tara:strand:+ start:279 stop:1073 length:795 start_codon:yes stop_codon:yes gene_type:complete
MFISSKICFLELEKTGISSIKKFLKNHINEGVITRPHDYVTEEILNKKLFFLGSIRNPLDWYVSRWSYGCMMKTDDSLFRNLIKKRFNISRIQSIEGQYLKKIYYLKNQFLKNNRNLENLYSDPYNHKNFQLWLKEILLKKKNNALAEQYYFSSLNKNFGYMTFRYLIMFTKPQQRKKIYSDIKSYKEIEDFDKSYNFINKFMKVENLQNDLENLLKELGINKKNEIEIINPSKRNKDSDFYYDKESIEIVKNQDKYIFNKFNY